MSKRPNAGTAGAAEFAISDAQPRRNAMVAGLVGVIGALVGVR